MLRHWHIIAQIVLVVLLLASPGFSEPGQRHSAAEAYKARGNIYYGQRKLNQAIAEFTRALHEDPDYLPAYYNRGLAFHDLKLYYKAIVDFDMVIMMNSEDSDAYLARGLCYSKVNKLKLALQDIAKAAELGNRQARLLLDSGDITRQIEQERSKQRKINAIINENQTSHNRVSETILIGNEFNGNSIMTTYIKGDPLYDGKEGLFKQIDHFDPSDRLKKTELFHTASFIADNDKNMTTIWYDAQGRIIRKEFTYTGKMLNLTGIQFYNDQGVLSKEVILDKHGKEVSAKTFP